jgi:signal peptide peptidase SppA
MKYEHIARYVANTLWAITPEKMAELLEVLAYRAAGGEFTPEEIKARIGDSGGPPARGQQGGDVAVIPMRGVIAHRMSGMEASSGGTSAEGIARDLRQAMADSSVGTILLDVDSPGGTVPGIQELAGELFEMRERGTKRIVAQVNSLAASAAYWLASQADEIVSLPSGTAGSIGVFSVHQDLSKALENEGINVTLISAGKYKVAGNPFEPLSDDERAVIQARVDTAYGQFVKDVARGRGVSASAVRSGYGEGRALAAKDALKAGLIDRIATMDETIGRLVGRTAGAGGLKAKTVDAELVASLPQADGDDGQADDRARRHRLL